MSFLLSCRLMAARSVSFHGDSAWDPRWMLRSESMRSGGVSWMQRMLEWTLIVSLLLNGSTGLVCHTAVESLDLGCLLRWDCPHASPNITYSVQTKTQGLSPLRVASACFLAEGLGGQASSLLDTRVDQAVIRDPWQDVPWCVWISSHTCDVSRVFSNFELYNMIRLGVHLAPGSAEWMKPHKFDYSDFTFSPPSVSVSWSAESLLVEVQFPCAATRSCSGDGCCPITKLIHPWTTVTVYNQFNRSDQQSHTVWTQQQESSADFSGLHPGRTYCAVANFSFPTFSMGASPKSAPCCIQISSVTDPESVGAPLVLFLGICLIFIFLLLLLALFLWNRRQAKPNSQSAPKTSTCPHDLVSFTSFAVDPGDVHLELDQISVIYTPGVLTGPLTSTVKDVSSLDLVKHDPGVGTTYWDTGGLDPGISDSCEETRQTAE